MATPYSRALTGGGAANTTRIADRGGPLVTSTAGITRARRKFLRFFPKGFYDEKYVDWERDYKWEAHERWQELLNRDAFRRLLRAGEFSEIAGHAVRVESRTNLIFSFEKMALRDAIRSNAGAEAFATGLYDFIYGAGAEQKRFERWIDVVAELPRKQTRVLTWPIVTVFGFIARPEFHVFLKPNVTRVAAGEYGFDFRYVPRPNWDTYASLLELASTIGSDLKAMKPRDMIDIQSFIWVQGSDEYEE
jgi:hypothetical protein